MGFVNGMIDVFDSQRFQSGCSAFVCAYCQFNAMVTKDCSG